MLERMGGPLTFVGWIRTLYREVSSKVQINGFLSVWIAVDLEVRQGCLLSPILFVYTIEFLAQHLRHDPGICRVYIPGSSNREPATEIYFPKVQDGKLQLYNVLVSFSVLLALCSIEFVGQIYFSFKSLQRDHQLKGL
ncbi:hypothetical protein Y1Q_0004413 [Alligator mississippiensis]|uniref:Uncharacterized protein n=1 Tax=Alligator mississippiensis TaxID=8496 RepID=A0A151MW25_ALLMI|nr:hypothetical protein Y1Q_0004413 [Alligator mississippiensis]